MANEGERARCAGARNTSRRIRGGTCVGSAGLARCAKSSTWRVFCYSSEEPPLQRGLVLVDAVDGRIVERLVEDNPDRNK